MIRLDLKTADGAEVLRSTEHATASDVMQEIEDVLVAVTAGTLPRKLVDENGELTAAFCLDGQLLTQREVPALLTEHGGEDADVIAEVRAGNPLAGS